MNTHAESAVLAGQVAVRLTPGEVERLRELAAREDRPTSYILRRIIRRALDDEQGHAT